MLKMDEVKRELNIFYPEGRSEEMLTAINGKLDIGMAGALREYLFPYDEYNTLSDKLDEIITEPGTLRKYGFTHDFNIFPAKEATTEIFPDFLCVCRGKTRLSTAFSQMKKVSNKMVKIYGCDNSLLKNVLLITDKWDYVAFKKYEADFLYKAINCGVWFVIMLISGNELRQIPFLPNDRMCFRDVRWAIGQHFEEEFRTIKIEYPLEAFSFEVIPGTWNQTGHYRYRFNPESLSWHKESVTGECKNGSIPKQSLDKFMRNMKKLMDEKAGTLISENNSCDDPGYVLNLFGKVINWAYSDTENNADLKRLRQIIDEFIQKCDTDYLKG